MTTDTLHQHADAVALDLLRRWQRAGDRRSATVALYDGAVVVTLYADGDQAGEGRSPVTGTTAEAALDALRQADRRTPTRSDP